MDAEAYDRAWRIEQRVEERFKRDYPTGSFARRLPQFRSSYPDPVGDYYRELAAQELISNDPPDDLRPSPRRCGFQ